MESKNLTRVLIINSFCQKLQLRRVFSMLFANYTKRQRQILLSSSLGMCLELMDIMFIAYTLSLIKQEFELNGAQAGFISTATNLAMLAGGLLFGYLADRYGKIKVFSYSIVLFAVGTGLIFFAQDYYWLIFFRVLAGLGGGGEYGVGMSLIASEFGKERMGKYASIVGIFGQIGVAAAAILAGIMLANFGWRYLFLIGLVPVVLAMYIRFGLEECKDFTPGEKLDYKGALKGHGFLTVSLCIMSSIQIAGYFGMMNWLPTMAKTTLNLTDSNASYWMVSTITGMSIGMWVFGRVFDKFGPRFAYGVFLIGSAVLVFSFTLIQNYTQLLIAGFVIGFFSNGMFGGYGALANILYEKKISSSANNLIVNVGRAVGGFSSVAIGYILDITNKSNFAVMAFLSCLYVLSFVVMLCQKELRHAIFETFKKHENVEDHSEDPVLEAVAAR